MCEDVGEQRGLLFLYSFYLFVISLAFLVSVSSLSGTEGTLSGFEELQIPRSGTFSGTQALEPLTRGTV